MAGRYPDIRENVKAGDVVVYVDSEVIEADLKRIEQAGGKTVYPKIEIPGIGWFATFTDPAGSTPALYTSMPR
jgi:hypothetical protein